MLGYINSPVNKPNRVQPDGGKKDKKYHADYGKYCVSNSYSPVFARWLEKYALNKRFYANRQWDNIEDITTFLRDASGNERNRIQVTFNLIRGLVENFRGNGKILRIGAVCKSSSPLSITRKEEALAERMFKFEVSQQAEVFAQALGGPEMGETEEETKAIFENTYVDRYVESMNSLLRYIKDFNKFENMQIKIAEDMALSGLGVVEGFEYNQHLRFENVPPEEFFWDTSAKQYDFSDAEFMGRAYQAMPTEIYEQYDVDDKNKEAIEKFIINNSSSTETFNSDNANASNRSGFSENRIPVYRSFWKDIDVYEYGYVMSEYGDYKVLVRLNTLDDDGNKKYTDDMLVDPPDNKIGKRFKGGKKKTKFTVDTIRYCVFIPSDVLASKDGFGAKKNEVDDIVLEYGVLDNQEVNNEDWRSAKFPFKCYAWGYVDGEVLSPVDDAISPQRFINRVLSVFENQVNNSSGSNIIIDKSAIDPQEGEEGIMKNMAQSKPITINSRNLGITNTVGHYDATPKAGTYGLMEIIPTIKNQIDQTTGVNEALRGESIGQDQLVGVTNSLIQRGSLMQEPFYHGVSNIFHQMYEMGATVGKNIYIDNEASLHLAVGDDAAVAISLAKDMKNEDFRVFVKRDVDEDSSRQTADQMLMAFLESGLIDQKDFANLYNRSTPDEVTKALRNTAKARIEVERQNMKMQQEQEAAMAEQEQAQMQQQEQMMQQQEAQKYQQDLEKEDRKSNNKLNELIIKEELKQQGNNTI
jgi:hypothetical protein